MKNKKILAFIIMVLPVAIRLHGEGREMHPLIKDMRCLFGCTTEKNIWVANRHEIRYVPHNQSDAMKLPFPGEQGSIQCLAGAPDHLLIGTDTGLFVWDEIGGQWSHQLNDMNVLDIAFDGQKIWMVTTQGVVSCFVDGSEKVTHSVAFISPYEKLSQLCIYQDRIWAAGTYGIYGTYGKGEKFYPFELLTTEVSNAVFAISGSYIVLGSGDGTIHIIDTFLEKENHYSLSPEDPRPRFITALLIEGRYLWVGTFDGIAMVNIFNGDPLEGNQFDERLSMVEFFIRGDAYIYVGTDRGLYKLKRPYKPWMMHPHKTFFYTKESHATFSVEGHIQDMRFEYRLLPFPEHWHKARVSILNNELTWDLGDIVSWNERYELRAVPASSEDTIMPLDSSVIHMDVDEPKISFDSFVGIKKPGPVTITGRFNKYFIEHIVIYPFDISPRVDRKNCSFKAVINLDAGMNVIKAKLTDRWGREALTEIKIYVNK